MPATAVLTVSDQCLGETEVTASSIGRLEVQHICFFRMAGTDPAAPQAQPEQHRFVMPALLSFQPTTNWIIRNAINTLIPFICREQGFSEDQRAMLLAAFYPGYVGAHIPGGILVQHLGGKVMLSANMIGSALICALLPLAARVKLSLRAPAFAALLAALGVMQGPLIPSLQTMRNCLNTH